MTIEEIVHYVIIGIYCGAFATFAPVLFGKAVDIIFGIVRASSN